MAEVPTRSGPTQLAATTTTIKTAGGAGTWVVLRSVLLCNTHTSVVTVNLGIGTANTDTAAKRITSALALNAGETVEVLAPGFIPLLGHASTPDLLYGLASVASVVTVTLGCVEGP